MNSFLQADIFFFVTTIALAVISITLLIALVFLIQILRDVRHVSRRVREQSDEILSDIESLRSFVKKEGKKAISVKEVISSVVGTFLSKRKPRRKTESEK